MSSGASSEELSFLLLPSVLGYEGFQNHANCYCLLLFFFLFPSFFDPPSLEDLSHYIFLSSRSWSSICWSCRSSLECSSYQPPSQILCELRQPRPHCSGVISSLMQSECWLGAFNAEVTVSPWIIPTPYAHGYPTVLVLFMGALWGAAFIGVPFFPPGIWDVENRIILGNVFMLFGLSLFVLGHSSLLGVGLGLSIKWAGVVKFFDPTATLQFLVIYIYIYIYTLCI